MSKDFDIYVDFGYLTKWYVNLRRKNRLLKPIQVWYSILSQSIYLFRSKMTHTKSCLAVGSTSLSGNNTYESWS